MNASLISSLVAVVFALLVIAIRLRAANKPTSLKKILLPPLGMSLGFFLFTVPQTHLPWSYAILSLLVGFVFSYPLIRTSHFEITDGKIFLKRSKAFVLILLGLLVLRMAIHSVIEPYISLPQTGAAFFLLAYGMIAPWRVAMYARFRQVENRMVTTPEAGAARKAKQKCQIIVLQTAEKH